MDPAQTPITLAMIVVTALISFGAFSSGRILQTFVLSPWHIAREGRWYQLVSSGFLHANMAHLFFNMFTLYFFGRAIEVWLGGAGFLIVYFGSMLAGSYLSFLRHRNDSRYRALGASGAVSGILFSFILFRPFAPIHLFLLPIGIPAVLFAVGYVAISVYGMRTRFGRIGHDAHLGGAVGGLILTLFLYPKVLGIFLSNF